MIFNNSNVALVFSVLLSSGIISVQGAIPLNKNSKEAQDIDRCMEACEPFKSQLKNFIDDITNTGRWARTKKAFTTCQWKCHRCSLHDAVAAMDQIESLSSVFADSYLAVSSMQYGIYDAIDNCKEQWQIAVMIPCSKNPVEDVDVSCKE